MIPRCLDCGRIIHGNYHNRCMCDNPEESIRVQANGISLPAHGAEIHVNFTERGDAWVHISLEKGKAAGAEEDLPEVIDFRVDHIGQHAGDHNPVAKATKHIAVRLAKV